MPVHARGDEETGSRRQTANEEKDREEKGERRGNGGGGVVVVVGVTLYNDTERINPSGGVAAATRPA